LLVDGANVGEESILEVDGVNSRELADEVASNITSTTVEEAEAVRVAEEDSAGRTTTSLNATVMHLLTSSLTGSCWRRLISTVWRS
jgi:hypothetical protein